MKKINKELELKVIELYINNKINSTIIAKDLGISFNSVVRIVKRNGYETRKTADVNRGKKLGRRTPIDIVIDLYTNQNKSSGEIAKLLSCTDVTVLNILRDNKISVNPPGFFIKKEIDEEKIKQLYNSGVSIKKVASELNYTIPSVHGFLKRNGLTKPENSSVLNKGRKMPKESCVKMGDTKRQNKKEGLYDHIYLKRTGLTYLDFQKQLPAFKKYFNEVRSISNKQPIKTLINFEKRGKMGTDGAYNIDHKYSIIEGFKNNVDPKIIGHIANLEMITWEENNSKHGSCSITLKELKKLINSQN